MSDHASEPILNPDEVVTSLLDSPRRVWVQQAASSRATMCLLVLDAELYIERVRAPQIVVEEQRAERIPNVNCVYVSSISGAARHADYTCNREYAQFLATDLIDRVERRIGPHERYTLCGLSLSGLQAAFTALSYPAVFHSALCQSPSAWWNEEWLAGQIPSLSARCQRFWLSVGWEELQQGVSHAPTGLFQGGNQLDSCRRLSSALRAAGHEIRANEYSGGHDPKWWSQELPSALQYLLNDG